MYKFLVILMAHSIQFFIMIAELCSLIQQSLFIVINLKNHSLGSAQAH
jgi:hypothetical protein